VSESLRAKSAYGQNYDHAYQEYDSKSERKRRAKIVEDVTNRLYRGSDRGSYTIMTKQAKKELERRVLELELKKHSES
jgi:hypothetical protein